MDRSDKLDRSGYRQRQRVDGELLAPAWGKMLINGRMAAVLYTTAECGGLAAVGLFRRLGDGSRRNVGQAAMYLPFLIASYRYLPLCSHLYYIPLATALCHDAGLGKGLCPTVTINIACECGE